MNIIATASKAINTIGAVNSIVGNVRNIFGLGGNAPGAQGHNGFLAQVRKKGVAKRNLFNVVLPAPLMMTGEDKELYLHLFAENLNLPGVNFATSDIRRYGHGPMEKKPFAPIFTDLNINFIADGKGDIHKYFYKWMRNIINFDNPRPGTTSTNRAGLAPFEINFKDQYRTDITIYTYNEMDDKIIEMRLYGAYPIAIADTPLNWAENDQFMSIAVTFTYTNLEIVNLEEPGPNGKSNLAEPSLLQKILQVGSAVQVLGALKKPRSIADVVNVTNNAKIAVSGLKGLFGP